MRARAQQPRGTQEQAGSIGGVIHRPRVAQLPTNSRIHPKL